MSEKISSGGAATGRRHFLMIWLIIVAVILYGSLYPFDFAVPENGAGPLRHLLSTVAERPGRADFTANVILYMPFGLFLARGLVSSLRAAGILIVSAFAGACLSGSIESLQYYDAGRVSSMTDVYANTLGAIVGATLGAIYRGTLRVPYASQAFASPVATLLLSSWAAYRLYPYVPVIDLHKYWDALKPLVVSPEFHPFGFFRQLAVWLTTAVLIEAITGMRRASSAFVLFLCAVLGAEIFIAVKVLTVDEVGGAVAALLVWLLLAVAPQRGRAFAVAFLLLSAVIAERLAPFDFAVMPHAFGWIPFYGFMHGSIDVDVQSFFEKFFMYGGVVWLLARAGVPIRSAAALVSGVLFLTSWAEIYLPDRSAEITDGLMAIMIAETFARMRGAATDTKNSAPLPALRRNTAKR